MNVDYESGAQILKILSDAKRLKIIDMLSSGEKCACELLDFFDFTQPTLSYHMKLLMESGLVNSRKDAQWNYYTLNQNKFNQVILFLMTITTETEDGCHDNNEIKPGKGYKRCCG